MKILEALALFTLLVWMAGCRAVQAEPGAVPDTLPSAEGPPPSAYAAEPDKPEFVLPSLGDLPAIGVGGEPRFILRKLQFTGNTVFTDAKLNTLAEDLLNHPVSMADLETLRIKITDHYHKAGFVTSGAILPDQHIKDGVVQCRIVEGHLNGIRIDGAGDLPPGYIEERLNHGPDRPLNMRQLQERFRLLLTDPLIERINGELRPGQAIGESTLNLQVTRARPYELWFELDNNRPPSVGSLEALAGARLHNLTGHGDLFSLELSHSGGAADVDGGWTFPLSPADTRLSIHYRKGESSVVEEALQEADIRSDFRTLEIGIDHPLLRNVQSSLRLGMTLALHRSQTFLLGQGTAFSAGVEPDGRSRTSILRLIQDYAYRELRWSLAARSTFNLGLDAFDATVHRDLPDGRFLSWIGQVRYAHRLGDEGAQIVLRGAIQLADDGLLPLERFAVGGIDSVRGYRENEYVRDNGYSVSVELRHPLSGIFSIGALHGLQIAAFYDAGAAWNHAERANADWISALGLGLLWDWNAVSAKLYVAHALNEATAKTEYDLQDDGIHFHLRIDM